MKRSYSDTYEAQLPINSEHAPGGVLVYYADGDEEIIHVNTYVVDLFECENTDEFLEYVHGSFRGLVYADDVDSTEENIWLQVADQRGLDHIYYRIRTKSGRITSVDDFGRLVESHRNGRPVFYVFLSEVTQSGHIDWLTGLPSMTRFFALAQMGVDDMRARGEQPVAVALNLVGMKSYNTRHGSAEGDRLLRAFANVLRNNFGPDACSRFVEDHFYAFSSRKDVVGRIEAIFADFSVADVASTLPVRVGAYACEEEDDIVEVGFNRAKIACDLDRTTWFSHLTWFTDQMRAETHLRLHVCESLDRALLEGWIRPYYQTIVRTTTGEACGEEALARWNDPEYGELAPRQFMPILDEAGLTHRVDLHMIDCIVADILARKEHGIPLEPISINISPTDFEHMDIAEELTARFDAAGLSHELLRVELTESVDSLNVEVVKKRIDALHESGFQVWMDDFGSGFYSLNVLQKFDFDLIKLDMEFMRGNTEEARTIVEGIVQTAAKLGVGTIAEGVETHEQYEFLERIGCDMLQGYFFAQPQPIEAVLSRVETHTGLPREALSERLYWDVVGTINLEDLSSTNDMRDAEGVLPSEFPAGVMECRKGVWRILRANQAYADFLHTTDVPDDSTSSGTIITIEEILDSECLNSFAKSRATGTWQRISGHLGHGSKFQFYVRHLASVPDADAYLIGGIPTMLGTALGSYGDVPVAYAVFRAVLNEAGDEVIDAEYVYANDLYCEWVDIEPRNIVGRSYLELIPNANTEWFPYYYRAAVQGKHVHDVIFSPEFGHWVSFNISPSLVEGHCVFAFSFADKEQFERQEMVSERDTSDLIIAIADALSDEDSYDVAVNNLLVTLSAIVPADRLFVVECASDAAHVTFEWCAKGIEPRSGILRTIASEQFDHWGQFLQESPVFVASDVQSSAMDAQRRAAYAEQGIRRMLKVPLYSNGRLIGFFGADNFVLDSGLDTERLLGTLGSFLGSRIANHRLVAELERLGLRDGLTGLLNRRGIDLAIDKFLTLHPDEHYALALMDVDDFKTVNDLHGHDIGDEALRLIAREIESTFPTGAITGRNGGDEFLIMLPGKAAKDADELFANFSKKKLSCTSHRKQYNFTVSIGYVSVPEQAGDLKTAYGMADAALYAVKLAGKSGHGRYTLQMGDQHRSQLGFTPRDIAENVPGAIMIHHMGPQGKILFVNNEVIDLFECDDLDDFMRYTSGIFGHAIHPDDRRRAYETMRAQLSTAQVGDKKFLDYRILTKAGNVRHVADFRHLVEVDGTGKVVYELLVSTDERSEA